MSPFQEVDENGCKPCSKCGEAKPVAEFSRNKHRSSGYDAHCKKCHRRMPSQHGEARRKASRDWYRRNGMARLRQTLYGLTPDEYDALMEKQAGVCAICGEPETQTYQGNPKCLAVDHCHDTGAVRGLLCSKCNVAIGMLNHDLGLLDRARVYLGGGRP